MKKLSLIAILALSCFTGMAQVNPATRSTGKSDKKEAKRQHINAMIRQAEEGVLIYSKQSIFGVQLRSNGYGGFFELGKMKTNRKTSIYRIDITETKSLKEEKLPSGGTFFGNPYIYGKQNYFYPVTIGMGQQYILGQKGNKNGVAVSAVYNAGVSLGLLRPYYLQVFNQTTGETETIRYSSQDSAKFLGQTIVGGGGLGKGWNQIKMKPGVYAKTALRFDYGRFNEMVSGLEIGISAEYYMQKIPIMLKQNDKQLFIQTYISIIFGRRK